MIQANNTLVVEELIKVLFHLDPSTPFYADMAEIKKRKEIDSLEFYSHKKVWGE